MEVSILREPWEQALTHEWLVTDSLGGYASGTVVGPNTRRYHGLLVAPLAPPLGRHVLLAKLDEAIEVAGARYDLATNEFHDGTVHPRGYERLLSFRLVDGLPVWRYAAGPVTLEKRVWMERGQRTVYTGYTLHGEVPARLLLTPLCAFRDFHRETIGSEDWRFQVEPLGSGSGVTVHAYPGATPYHLLIAPPAGRQWSLDGPSGWWWQFLHRAERERGLDHLEDLYAIGTFACDLPPGATLIVAATVEDPRATEARLTETMRRIEGAGGEDSSGAGESPDGPFVAQLRRAAHQFLVARAVPGAPPALDEAGAPAARTVIAGYHWFGDWGRDTMIALPGLALATGRFDEASAILRAFSRYVDRGMLPNRFPDSGAPLGEGDYNTLDATLWYFHAIDAIAQATGDSALVADLYPVLDEIIAWHVRGTRFGIRVDPADGLVRADNPQLTWMDAKVGDWVVTPRAGKPVEIAALWHHALGLMERWAGMLYRADDAGRFGELRRCAAEGFRRRFWNAAAGYLYDVVDGPGGNDASLRPNQIIAAALPDCPLEPAQRKAVVDAIVRDLWTPRGLRTLSPHDPRYCGRYEGDPRRRDGAYHQGTVWPWLLGPLVDAHLLVYGDRAAARRLIEPLREHLFAEAGVGSISEIFDGDAPHAPRGCIAQAWSVAEVFRAWMRTEPGPAPGGARPGTQPADQLPS